MSFVTNTGVSITVPQIITQDLFPNIYALDVPEPIFDDMYDLYPNIYQFGLPNVITRGIDPAYITGPQKYEYKYTNANGVTVVLRGTYNDVMSSIDVLNTYPPIKKECTNDDKKRYYDLYGPGSYYNTSTNVPNVANVPIVGAVNNGKYIQIKMDGKTFSGSGSLILVVETGKPLSEAKIVLFRDSSNNMYQDLGGRIDKPNKAIDKDTLFNNAKKETEEESMKLFSLDYASPIFVDIESGKDNTIYRVYLYIFNFTNINQLSTLYDENKDQILITYSGNFDESYKETNKLELFDYKTFMTKLASYNPTTYSTSSGVFQTLSGNPVNVRGRTLKVIDKLRSSKKFDDVMNNNKLSNSTVTKAPGLFNTITLKA